MIRPSISKVIRSGRIASFFKQRNKETPITSTTTPAAAATTSIPMFLPINRLHTSSPTILALNMAMDPSNDVNIRWKFPVDDRTEGKIMQVHHDAMFQSCIITLNSSIPISHDLMKETLTILYEKMESLRICYRVHDNQLWIAEMTHHMLDFKSINGSSLDEEHNRLIKEPFDLHNGPLWKVRLRNSPSDELCHFPQVKTEFPYQYDLLFSVHHAANDGVVIMLIIQLVLGILDNLLQGLPVDCRPIGKLKDGIEARQLEDMFRQAYESNPERLKKALKEYESTKHTPLLIEAFGTPTEPEHETHVLPEILLDKDMMGKINGKCRSLGITINSFMTALSNTALVKTVREGGLKRDNYSITSSHPVNTRRLMEKSPVPYLGFHGIQMTFNMQTPHDVKNHFWEYAKTLDTKFRNKIKDNWAIEERTLQRLSRPEGYTHDSYYSRPPPLTCDYLFSNLFSPDNSIQSVGKKVQITSTINKATLHKSIYPLGIALFGFRGQARFEMGCSRFSVEEEVTRKFFHNHMVILKDIASVLS